MLKKRLIPKLQLRNRIVGGHTTSILVTTEQFGGSREIGNPISQAKIYQSQLADELIFIDIDATTENRNISDAVVKQAAEEIFIPFTVGGGVRSLADIRHLLLSGADKVCINSAALLNPEFIRAAAVEYGSQCVVVSIDYRKEKNGTYSVYSHGGKRSASIDPVTWAIRAQELGAGEILLTSIDRDGTRTGIDCDLSRRVQQSLTIPVITSGGCGTAAHFIEAYKTAGVDAVAAGTYFCYQDQNPIQTRAHILNAGVPIRIAI